MSDLGTSDRDTRSARADRVDRTDRAIAAQPKVEDDDFERDVRDLEPRDPSDCSPRAAEPLGARWDAYHDDECHGEESESTVTARWSDDREYCVTYWSGHVSGYDNDTFAAIGTGIQVDSLSDYRKLRVEVRGNGTRMRAQFPTATQLDNIGELNDDETCESDWYDYYGQAFKCGDGSERWSLVEIDLRKLKQRGWGKRVARDLDEMSKFEIVTYERPVSEFNCDIRAINLAR